MPLTLALDLAQRTGFCIGDTSAERQPDWGFWDLPAFDDAERMMATLRNGVQTLFEQTDPLDQDRRMIIERRMPSFSAGGSSAKTGDQQTFLEAIARLAAYDYGIRCEIISPLTARAAVFGKGNGKVTTKEKVDGLIVRRLHATGYSVFDHNAADALVLWLWRQEQDRREHARQSQRKRRDERTGKLFT